MDVETRARQVSPGVVGWRMARHPWLTRPLGVGPADNARPGGQGSATGIGTGLGPWDGTHSFESKVQGPRSKVFGPLGSEAVRGERARGVRLNLPHLTWGPGRDTGWDGTSISSHCYFVTRWRPKTSLVGKTSPPGTKSGSPPGWGSFFTKGERIPGKPGRGFLNRR
jgi:hypothetical protein